MVDIARGASGPRPREEQQRDANEREGYHGTSSSAAKEIMKHGFRRSTGGMLGPGVYCTFTRCLPHVLIGVTWLGFHSLVDSDPLRYHQGQTR